jgi:hypothetical protein
MLVIEPLGGLCNRMRALDAAISLAQATQQQLYVIWVLDSSLNSRLEDLFDLPNRIHQVIYINRHKKVELIKRKLLKLPFIASGRYLYDIDHSIQDLLLKEEQDMGDIFKNFFRKERFVYICTGYRFYPSARPFTQFRATQLLQQRIDRLSSDFNQVVGVHIRRTDNIDSIRYSPTSWFVQRMQQEVRRNPLVKFFLATDSLPEEDYIKDLFPGKIIVNPKSSLDRNDPAAIRDAVVDLYCLARTQKLIGSYFSSFTETASEINCIETIIAERNQLTEIVYH